ncbi:MAG: hypothetical protein LKI34_02910 [Bifidobacterium tibiigranuli]|jgi:hypothetical protein|nr:hypothetical protein [Bifidobacterium tibiigranuli]MCI1673157.1 hypothetical protein [Bifidobacterium tibiigranuli]MCI1713598.1 hypothetical protein [Bifidobacterium tibiigranuli]
MKKKIIEYIKVSLDGIRADDFYAMVLVLFGILYPLALLAAEIWVMQ